MSQEQEKTNQNEDLNKSIDALIDDIFSEDVEKASSIDIAQDSETTADKVKAPKAQDDAARGAGRPKQISDVPSNDQDGQRAKDYDGAITENEGKEDEPDETDQSPSMDQTQDKKRIADKPKAPQSRPFKKSEEKPEGVSEEEWAEFQEFKKSKAEAEEKAKQEEEMKKAEAEKKEQEDLIKSAVAEAVSGLKEEYGELKKAYEEQSKVLKAMASQPKRAKSVTGIEQLEKSVDPETSEPEAYSMDELKDATFELAMKGEIPQEAVSELEMTKSISDVSVRNKVEGFLQKSQK